MKNTVKPIRWILLASGIVVIFALTAMNVYSLYTLRNNAFESEVNTKKIQLAEFSERVRYRFFDELQGFSSIEARTIEQQFRRTGRFPENATEILQAASDDPIFKDIYFVPENVSSCQSENRILEFNGPEARFESTSPPPVICEGLAMARTRMNTLMQEGYRFGNKVLFDTHRSLFVSFINQSTNSVFGYLAIPIDQTNLIHEFLQPAISNTFENYSKTGFNVWVRNWTNGKVIASSNSDKEFNIDNIEFVQRFPDLFDDWRLYASYDEAGILASSTPSLVRNLTFLGAACIVLIGAMLFLFISAQRERELANRQSGFLANVTHELKTPLAVIQAAGENLSDGRIGDKSRVISYGKHIHSEAIRLRRMIDNLLTIAKNDAGHGFMEPEPIHFGSNVSCFINKHKDYIHNKGFTIDAAISENTPMVMLNPESLDTIMRNLVNNAIKYSDDNQFLGIYVSYTDTHVTLKVKDKGIGMTKKSIKYIFEKFYRVEDSLTAKTKGYGLGLSIVHKIVDFNNGSIEVKSVLGQGSTFIVTFPALKKEHHPKSEENAGQSGTPEIAQTYL